MANVKPHWWGINVILGHSETCNWTDPMRSDVASLIAAATTNVYAAIIVAAVNLQKRYIREQNESSGCKGVRLLITWAGIYIGCERRSTGPSQCGSCAGGTSRSGTGGTSGSGGAGGSGSHSSTPNRVYIP